MMHVYGRQTHLFALITYSMSSNQSVLIQGPIYHHTYYIK